MRLEITFLVTAVVYLVTATNVTTNDELSGNNTDRLMLSEELPQERFAFNWFMKSVAHCELYCVGKTCRCCKSTNIAITLRTCVEIELVPSKDEVIIKLKNNNILTLPRITLNFRKLINICPVIRFGKVAIKACLETKFYDLDQFQNANSQGGFSVCVNALLYRENDLFLKAKGNCLSLRDDGSYNWQTPFSSSGYKLADFNIVSGTDLLFLAKDFVFALKNALQGQL